jgi:hypothetical protein
MPARIPCRGLLGLGPCLALLQGCAAVLGSKSTDAAVVPQPPRAEVVLDGARLDVTPDIVAVESNPARSATEPNPNADARVRSGFHFNLGLGAGRADLTCDGCVFDSRTGYSAFLSVARSVAQKTLLGVEATGWTKERSGTSVRIYSLMAHLTEYLNRSSGLFLRAGLGLTGFREDGGFREISGNGFGLSGRLGYELGTGGVVIVPYVGYVRGLGGGGVNVDDSHSSTDVIIHNFQFGLGIAAP